MTTFLDLARRRRSIRSYTGEAVPDALLDQVLEAGRLAPTACNKQPFRFVVVRGQEQRQRICGSYRRGWLATAPVLIILCVERDAAWVRNHDGKSHGDIDAAIAADHMTLAACEAGLGSCWVCAFDPALVREALAIPAGFEPAIVLSVGYPAEDPAERPRKAMADLVVSERWPD
jgi:nitroreductase